MENGKYSFEWSVGHWRNKGLIEKFWASNGNENSTYQDLWDKAKAILRGKFMSAYKKIKEIANK
jgi:hypothetical protein